MRAKIPKATVGSIINYSLDIPEKRYSMIVYGDDAAITQIAAKVRPFSTGIHWNWKRKFATFFFETRQQATAARTLLVEVFGE